MNVVGDLVARGRRSDSLAIQTERRAGSASYNAFCTTAWKAGNLLTHYGVRPGATVAIDWGDGVSLHPLTAFFGSALLGATAQFDPADTVDASALVAPADRLHAYDPAPGTKVLGYGDVPDDPEVAGFERDVWSENPTEPPETVSATATALSADDRQFTHEHLLTATERVATDAGLDRDDSVIVRTSVTNPETFVAGVLAPLVVGATILVDQSATGDVAVTASGASELRTIDPKTVELSDT